MASEESKANVGQPRAVWLSSPEYKKSDQGTMLQEQISDVLGNIKLFDEVDRCEEFIRDRNNQPPYEQIFLIVTMDCVQPIFQRDIHDLRVLEAILVYDHDKSTARQSLEKYSKVDGIYSNATDLRSNLSKCVDNFSRDSGILLSSLKQSEFEMTANIINNFADYAEVWYPLFLDLLFDLPRPNEETRAQHIIEFAKQCQRFYAHDSEMLKQVKDFLSPTEGYSSKVAVNYYTRDTFLFKRANKALRQQNFQAILYFRFFLLDMEAQLQSAYGEFCGLYDVGEMMTFYRGQCMSEKEIDHLMEQRRTGSLITVNSYVSTSTCRNTALGFVRPDLNGGLIPVICEITAEFKNPQVTYRKPFAYIGHFSQFLSAECEVLFSLGSFFRVDSVDINVEEKLYVIRLTFVYDEEHYTITDDYSTLRTCPVEEKLIKTGNLLSKRSQHGHIKAQAFYQRFLTDSDSFNIKAACHAGLGWLALREKEYSRAENHQQQALQMYATMDNVDNLYVSSYSCLGAVYWQQRKYSKALSYYLKAHEIDPLIVPIDKYAFYNSFINVPAVNVACLYKIQGEIALAWSTYKTMLALQMRSATHLHAAVYLKIAEAGFAQETPFHSNDEEIDWIQHWQNFLDLSLTEMSSSYRRSIVSGVLSIGWRLANNEQRRDVVLAYYKKIIEISQPFIDCSQVDYGIVLRCYEQIAKLYREKNSLIISIKYAIDGLKLCRVSDLKSILTFYKIIAKAYEEQLKQFNSNLSPLDIDMRIGTIYLAPTHEAIVQPSNPPPPAVLNFQRDEFAFGQYKKALNSNLVKEPDLKRCLTHCLLKIAAMQQELGRTASISELLNRAHVLVATDAEVAFVCANNLAYLDGKYDQIIENYQRSLDERRRANLHSCVGEDAFCYIAHLYEKVNRTDQAQQWYLKACQHFEANRLFCEHTRLCYNRVASFYERSKDPSSVVYTHRRLFHHLLNHRSETSPVQRDIALLMEKTLMHVDSADQIYILKCLVQLVLKPSTTSQLMNKIDDDVGAIITQFRQRKASSWVAAFIYESYLQVILKHNASLLTPCIQTTLTIVRSVADVYKFADKPVEAFEVFQRLVALILKYSNDRHQIVSFIKQLALDLELREYIRSALDIYDALYQFIYTHSARIHYQDNDLLTYILDRYQRLADSKREPLPPLYRKMIDMLQSYKQHVGPDFDMKVYIARLETYYMKLAAAEPSSAFKSYEHALDLFVSSQTERFNELLAQIVDQMKDRPTELLQLLTKYRVDYTTCIRLVWKRLVEFNDPPILVPAFPPTSSSRLDNFLANYNKRVSRYLNSPNNEQRIVSCWRECIYFLLEDCSRNDEYLALCYSQLNDPLKAAQIFDRTIYEEIAFRYCSNACRRYLKFIYPITDAREDLESRFAPHFEIVNGKREIRPIEPVKY